MKKLKNWVIKYKLPLILGSAEYLFQTIIYYIGQLFYTNATIIESPFDKYIPFISIFIYIYISWIIATAVLPAIVYTKNKESFYNYLLSAVICALIAGVIFIIYPTTIERYVGDFNGLSGLIVNILYHTDKPASCLPSLHAMNSFLFIYMVTNKNIKSKKLIVCTYIFSIAVVLSTFFIKQHVIYDALASLLISIIVYFIVAKLHLGKKLQNKINDVD